MPASSGEQRHEGEAGVGTRPGGNPPAGSSRFTAPGTNRSRSRSNTRKALHFTLAAVTGLFLLTGFGITHPEIIAPATGGLLDKAVSYQIHLLLWGPFLVILILHLFVTTSGHRAP